MANKTFFRFAIVTAALAVFLGLLFSWKYFQIRQQQAELARDSPPAAVEAVRVGTEKLEESLAAIGSFRAINGVYVANEIAGIVEAIVFSSGQPVAADEILLQLNADTDRAALETLKAEERLATQQHQRLADLIKKKVVSQADFDAAVANLDAAKARVLEQQAKLEKKTIRAPFAGLAGLRLVDEGQFLEVGTNIVQVVMSDPIYVDFTLAERELPKVKAGNKVEIRVAAFPGEIFAGVVEALNTSFSTQSRTIQVRAIVPNPKRRLQAGMFAEITLFSGAAGDVLTVPRTAISYNTYGDFVYVIRLQAGKRIVERRQVTTGAVHDGRVVITKGLNGSESVVKAGLLRLRSGQSVKVKEIAADAGATAPGVSN